MLTVDLPRIESEGLHNYAIPASPTGWDSDLSINNGASVSTSDLDMESMSTCGSLNYLSKVYVDHLKTHIPPHAVGGLTPLMVDHSSYIQFGSFAEAVEKLKKVVDDHISTAKATSDFTNAVFFLELNLLYSKIYLMAFYADK